MNLGDVYAIAIATGYGAAVYGLWKVRAAFLGLTSFGYLVFPILILWMFFYASLPFISEMTHRTFYVWTSRAAHTLSIVLLFLVIRLGSAVLSQMHKERTDV